MSRRALSIALFALVLLAVWAAARHAAALNARRARDILLRTEAAERLTLHSGMVITTVYAGPTPVATEARITCTAPRECYVEYLTPPVRGVLAVRDGTQFWRYDPAQGALYTEPDWEPTTSRRRWQLALLLRNYTPRLLDRLAVAGRMASGIALIHRYTRRVARRLWVDDASGLTLRSEEFDPRGELTMRTEYRTVSFAPPAPPRIQALPASLTRCTSEDSEPTTESALAREMGIPVLHPAFVPQGFEMEGVFRGRCACACGSPVAHLRYSDGLRTISVFQCAHRIDEDGCEITPLARSGIVRVHRPGGSFILIGEATEADLRRMANSLP